MTDDDLIMAARSMLDTPFQHQGRVPGLALDCAGLILCAARQCGIEVIDQSGYSRLPSGGLLEKALDDQLALERIAVNDAARGDVLLMRFRGDPQHLALLDGELIIHAYQPVGKVCEHLLSDDWRQRIVRAYRFRGLNG